MRNTVDFVDTLLLLFRAKPFSPPHFSIGKIHEKCLFFPSLSIREKNVQIEILSKLFTWTKEGECRFYSFGCPRQFNICKVMLSLISIIIAQN